MGIQKVSEYVRFYNDLSMGDSVSLLSFANNEKRILKLKLQNKEIKKEQILEGIKILDELILEIKEKGEKAILDKYI
jgi:hypothetical protein